MWTRVNNSLLICFLNIYFKARCIRRLGRFIRCPWKAVAPVHSCPASHARPALSASRQGGGTLLSYTSGHAVWVVDASRAYCFCSTVYKHWYGKSFRSQCSVKLASLTWRWHILLNGLVFTCCHSKLLLLFWFSILWYSDWASSLSHDNLVHFLKPHAS